MEILNKINVKNVVGSFSKPTDLVWLLRVAGIVHDIKQGEGVYGTWTCFLGDFRAINFDTGTSYSSGKCFLPDAFGDLLHGMLDGRGDNKSPIEFVVDIGIKPSDRAIGYEYIVKSLIEPAPNSPIDILLSRIGAPEYQRIGGISVQQYEEGTEVEDEEEDEEEEVKVAVVKTKTKSRPGRPSRK